MGAGVAINNFGLCYPFALKFYDFYFLYIWELFRKFQGKKHTGRG